ncbi:metal-dependent phosphohydrolase [Mycobacterium sp. ACS4331]|uniref:HD domain-containing protein n=1 Tax=Mycobacterium sp. ACS4331 TaxID=1834121 RepID=UPI0007FD1E35|nr:metal-dependent phosphohydrolase [Mycobacterium sp. ACS4331]OBF30000.1 metal-dependent phosphohydrolase [Mycobacterium sp. ACS4331]
MEDLVRAWRALLAPLTASPDVDAAGQVLLECWAEPHRHYHDLAHLRGVLSAIDDLEHLAEDPAAVRLAAWYHDAVYAGRADDEELSAVMAEKALSALGLPAAFVAEVARLIRMTVEHNPVAGDSNGAVLSDADLAVLALPRADYQRNSAAVRAEYAHVPEADFRAGRARVIRALLAEPHLYRTATARERWERAARENLAAELETLS